eukprot:COSAG06_NODE_3940_length_4742_cov_3.387680_2_plen_87_part_00
MNEYSRKNLFVIRNGKLKRLRLLACVYALAPRMDLIRSQMRVFMQRDHAGTGSARLLAGEQRVRTGQRCGKTAPVYLSKLSPTGVS